MAHHQEHTTTTVHDSDKDKHHKADSDASDSGASKMHAVKDKLIGGVKETLGTVVGSESMKESGREQKREGDAEAFAAGKGDKHYDPALARKGVGIQHKHMGPNPKKHTEGPCAGCKDGTCQVGHDYDAAIAHSVTQGHADAGHVKEAGLGSEAQHIHGNEASEPIVGHHQNIGGHHAPTEAVPAGHNVAYDAAIHSDKKAH